MPLTDRAVVADSERVNAWGVLYTARAVLSGAADLLSSLPDHLTEVTPVLEVAHVWV